MLQKVSQRLDELSKSERKVADVVLAEPEKTMHLSIAALAALAGVSEPTVNRFCRRLGTKGYPDFKLHLAQSLAHGVPYVSRHVDENDTVQAYCSKIYESTMAALDEARRKTDHNLINRAVDLLTQARKISFFGMGASAAVAKDAQNKFFRFNLPVMHFEDSVTMRMACINSMEGDVVVFFSHTGRTKSLVEMAQLARENDAVVIGVTAPDSPLAKQCNLVLSTHVPEDTDVYMPMASRIAQLVLIDILTTGFTLRRGAKCRDTLRKVKDSVRPLKYERD